MPPTCRDATEPCRIIEALVRDHGVIEGTTHVPLTLARQGHPDWLLLMGPPELWVGPIEAIAQEEGVAPERVRTALADAVVAEDLPDTGFALIDLACARQALRSG